jgi:protein CpxP
MNKDMGRGWMLVALLGVTAGTAGVAGAALAEGGGMMQAMHHLTSHGMPMDAAAMDAHFEKSIAELVPDATPEQKTRLKAITAAVHADMASMHDQFGEVHQRAHSLLLAPTIDRRALEALRVEQLRRFDTVSKHMVASLADAAAVLTPEQRQRLAAHLQAKPH